MNRRLMITLFLTALTLNSLFVFASRLIGAMSEPGANVQLLTSSIAICGAACAAVQFLRRRFDRERMPVYIAGALVTAAMVLVFFSLLSLLPFSLPVRSVILAVGLWVGCIVFAGTAGLVFGTALLAFGNEIPRLMILILCGAGAGGMLALGGTETLGPAASFWAASIPPWIAAIVMVGSKADKKKLFLASIPAIIVAAACIAHLFYPFFQTPAVKGQPVLGEIWSAPVHLAAIPGLPGTNLSHIAIDGNNLERGFPGKKDIQEFDKLSDLLFLLSEFPETLAIGPSAIIGVNRIARKSKSVTWVDPLGLSGMLSSKSFFPFPQIRKVVQLNKPVLSIRENPRTWLSTNSKAFDVIYAPLFDLHLSETAGPFGLWGDISTTLESWHLCFESLDKSGVFAVATYSSPPEYLFKAAIMARRIMAQYQVANPDTHIFCSTNGTASILLLKKEPISIHEASRLLDFAKANKLQVLYSPYHTAESDILAQISTSSYSDRIGKMFGISTPTDSHPFFFVTSESKEITSNPDQQLVRRGLFTYRKAAAFSGLWFLLVLLVPMFGIRSHRMALDAHLRPTGFFVALSLGIPFLLLIIMHQLRISLSIPGLNQTWILPITIVAAGIGAAVSSKFNSDGRPLSMRIFLTLFLGWTLFVIIVGPIILARSTGFAQASSAIALLFVFGLFAGFTFALALRRLVRPQRNTAPWMFGIAMAAFALGVTCSGYLAAVSGFSIVTWFGLGFIFCSIWLYWDL